MGFIFDKRGANAAATTKSKWQQRLAADGDEAPRRRRGRPRKQQQPETQQNEPSASQDDEEAALDELLAKEGEAQERLQAKYRQLLEEERRNATAEEDEYDLSELASEATTSEGLPALRPTTALLSETPGPLPLMADPSPEIKLLQRFKKASQPPDGFWGDFVVKCRLAWGVFFPPAPPGQASAASSSPLGKFLGAHAAGIPARSVMSPKHVVMSRLQLVLMADRCGVAPEQLLQLKTHSLGALAQYMDTELLDMEVQVSAVKPSGERLTMRMALNDILDEDQMRDAQAAHYEHEDEDDYFTAEEEAAAGFRVAGIAESDVPGRMAASVGATTVEKPERSLDPEQ